MTGTESESRRARRDRILDEMLNALDHGYPDLELATFYPRRGDRVLARKIATEHSDLVYVCRGRGKSGIVMRADSADRDPTGDSA